MKQGIEELLCGEKKILYSPEDALVPDRSIFLSGSFNPLHRGHGALLKAAADLTRRQGILELSVLNVDKPPLDKPEVLRRIEALKGRFPVVLTRAPTFREKAELLPGGWFVLGFDTALRLLDPSYHTDIHAILDRFAVLNTRFVVGGRVHENRFQSLQDLSIPPEFRPLFMALPEDRFREDISSTELRGEI